MCFAPQPRAIFRTSGTTTHWKNTTSRNAAKRRRLAHFALQMCFSPQLRAIFGHLNYQKWPESVVFSTFWLTNMLRATAACNFWTSQLPKWLRECGVLCILTCKCAFRHSRVAFWNIATSRMAPGMWCFVHFDLQMCFSPQPRGILEHRNFQNGFGNGVFCAFWLANVLFATAAWHFGTSELPKCLRRWGVFYILTRKCASRHSRVPFFTCPLNSYLRTRRFSEATFRTSGTTTHWKNTAIRDVTNIWCACWTPSYWLYTHVDLLATDSTRMLIFLLLTLHACWSSCYWHDCCATLLFNSTYCRKLDF